MGKFLKWWLTKRVLICFSYFLNKFSVTLMDYLPHAKINVLIVFAFRYALFMHPSFVFTRMTGIFCDVIKCIVLTIANPNSIWYQHGERRSPVCHMGAGPPSRGSWPLWWLCMCLLLLQLLLWMLLLLLLSSTTPTGGPVKEVISSGASISQVMFFQAHNSSLSEIVTIKAVEVD